MQFHVKFMSRSYSFRSHSVNSSTCVLIINAKIPPIHIFILFLAMEPLCDTNEIVQKYNTVDTENNYNFWKEEKFGTGGDDKQVINFLWPRLNYMKFSNTSPLSLVSTFCWKFLQRDVAHNQFSSIFKLSIFRWDLTRALDSWTDHDTKVHRIQFRWWRYCGILFN